MSRPKGMLLRKKPYRISSNGWNGIKVVLAELSNFKVGDIVYQERLDNGIVLLIPEEVYNENKE